MGDHVAVESSAFSFCTSRTAYGLTGNPHTCLPNPCTLLHRNLESHGPAPSYEIGRGELFVGKKVV